jgi:hypothetical protein
MKTIQEISRHLDILYIEQKKQEKELFEQMELLLMNASPMNIIGNTIENFISKNKLDEELPKLTLQLIINKLSEQFFSKSPILKNTLQTVISDLLISNIFEKKSKIIQQLNPGIEEPEKNHSEIQH